MQVMMYVWPFVVTRVLANYVTGAKCHRKIKEKRK